MLFILKLIVGNMSLKNTVYPSQHKQLTESQLQVAGIPQITLNSYACMFTPHQQKNAIRIMGPDQIFNEMLQIVLSHI